MLSVASLLNPVQSERRGTRLPSSPSSSFTTTSSYGSPQLPPQPSVKKQKMTKDGAVFSKGKIKGEVNFPPFEALDEETVRELKKFEVYPVGKIQEYCRHIPYNSEKKTFLEKTGRESFEVFQYTFKVPGDDKEYAVMWDYNIGLVRITPFFKCCKYSKTTPAKMLNMNPGLKEITHSITGGALAAQGYWMPYACALAVCATFCSHIAGALIPIFGPSFPSHCVPPEAPEHGRMIIDRSIVISATEEADAFRQQYSSFTPKSTPRTSYSPQHSTDEPPRMTPPTLNRRLRLKRTFETSAYSTPTDTDPETNGSEASSGDGYFYSPSTPASMASLPQQWNRNAISHSANSSIDVSSPKVPTGPNPWLSAIPRSTGLTGANVTTTWHNKRRVEEVDAEDDGYDGEDSGESVTDDKSADEEKASEGDAGISGCGIGGVEKKAAWLLMKLSVKDGERAGEPSRVHREKELSEGPRVKRRRATSV